MRIFLNKIKYILGAYSVLLFFGLLVSSLIINPIVIYQIKNPFIFVYVFLSLFIVVKTIVFLLYIQKNISVQLKDDSLKNEKLIIFKNLIYEVIKSLKTKLKNFSIFLLYLIILAIFVFITVVIYYLNKNTIN
ncbi:MAG: hypothetical protein OEZ13_11650 [Spirochaetia bacterium]|nr:hypothetical protein [Spirochaetia bacterium]